MKKYYTIEEMRNFVTTFGMHYTLTQYLDPDRIEDQHLKDLVWRYVDSSAEIEDILFLYSEDEIDV